MRKRRNKTRTGIGIKQQGRNREEKRRKEGTGVYESRGAGTKREEGKWEGGRRNMYKGKKEH